MQRIATDDTPAPARSQRWREAIASTYFPLDLHFAKPDRFEGELRIWELGDVSLSRLACGPLAYRRHAHHLSGEREEHFLVTLPMRAEVAFAQCGREVRCGPGGFFLERSHEPYLFQHAAAADLWVVKVSAAALGHRLRQPDRFCTLTFDAAAGGGGLFADMLELIPRRIDGMSGELRSTVGRQLIDLLALALKDDSRTLTSGATAVRAAHLARIEAYIRARLGERDLDPETIARACGISTRYLHELFRDSNQTVGNWIREQRLEACREALERPAPRETVAEIAYRLGFTDQAQFSRVFKARYGLPPREHRERAASRRQG
jgi:AraC-like DNA-binding protein